MGRLLEQVWDGERIRSLIFRRVNFEIIICHSSGQVSKQLDVSLESGEGSIMEIEDWWSSAYRGYLKLECGCNH